MRGAGPTLTGMRELQQRIIAQQGVLPEIDPAADNEAAIACYTKVGFRPVGILRQSERDNDGTWHDALMMDMLAAELTS